VPRPPAVPGPDALNAAVVQTGNRCTDMACVGLVYGSGWRGIRRDF